MTRFRNYKDYRDGTLFPFKWAFSIKSMVGVGILIGSLLPTTYASAAAALMLGGAVLRAATAAAAALFGLRGGRDDDPMTKQVVKGRKMAKIDGDFVVFHIGVRPNNKIDRYFKWMGDAMESMLEELEGDPTLGCLGGEIYAGTTGTFLVQYWKSMDHLNAYARSSNNRHASPWAKLMKKGRESTDYGFWHETFQVQAGQYESIFVNCPPILLGNCHGVDLVPCDEGRYRSAAGRAGKTDGSDYPEQLGKPDY